MKTVSSAGLSLQQEDRIAMLSLHFSAHVRLGISPTRRWFDPLQSCLSALLPTQKLKTVSRLQEAEHHVRLRREEEEEREGDV